MTDTDICNRALALVAEQPIMSLSDATPAARLCARHFVPAVREVLRDGQWRCARHRVALSPMADKPAFQWAFQFQLPGDFIRTIRINGHECGTPHCPLFEVEGRVMFANLSKLEIVYVRDVTQEKDGKGAVDLSDIDPLCAEAIVLKLAVKMAWSFQQSRTLRESLCDEFEQAMRRARNANSRDAFEKTEHQCGSRWIPARY